MTQEFVTSNGGNGACWSAPPPTNLDLAASGAQRRQQQQSGLFAADMELSLEQLPIRKRYLKSHSGGGGWDGGTATAAGSGGDEFISGGGLPAGDGENKSAARGGDLDARLRAGVIRHSSDPKRCLAYYYANKNPS
jgi:hypothetical protein